MLGGVDVGYGVLDAAGEPVDQRCGPFGRVAGCGFGPAGEVGDRVVAGGDAGGRAAGVGDRFGDDLLGGLVELGVVLAAVAVDERVGEFVK